MNTNARPVMLIFGAAVVLISNAAQQLTSGTTTAGPERVFGWL